MTYIQRDTLLSAVLVPGQTYGESASGKKDERPRLVACLKALQPGGALIVWKLDRLGRTPSIRSTT